AFLSGVLTRSPATLAGTVPSLNRGGQMFRSASRPSNIARKLLLSAAALPMALASVAVAQTAPAGQTETVVVTGSLIARSDYITATPTVTASTQDLQASGQIALEQGLIDLPQ